MNQPPVFLSAPRYVLGEIEVSHDAIEGLPERAAQLKLAPRPELWGWGSVRRTSRSLEELAVETGRATIAAAGIDSATIDLLVLCSTRFPGGAETHGGFVETIMSRLGLARADFVGVTLNRCTNLLAAVRVAQAHVSAGMARRVLVVTTDRITDESTRMESFALFSDGAASCLVGVDPLGANRYELVGSAAATDAGSLDWSNEISSDLAREVNEELLTSRGLTARDLAGLSQANVFLPLVMMKELQAGFAKAQIYTANITRFGHCFAADPLINLVDRQAAGMDAGSLHLLAASVPGARVAVLLRRSAVPAPSDDTGPPSPQPSAVPTIRHAVHTG